MNKNRKALIIDDNIVLLDILRKEIGQFCGVVKCCIDGYQALELLKIEDFDVFVVDYHLPGMKGFEIVKTLRSVCPDSYIVGMSAEKREAGFLASGANAFLLKPFDIDEILAYVTGSSGEGRA